MALSRFRFFILLVGVSLTATPGYSQLRRSDGILFRLPGHAATDARWLDVQVCTATIIHVTATQDTPFSRRPSLMVSKTSWETIPWSSKDVGDWTDITTDALHVRVNRQSGSVEFYDAAGTTLLRERPGGGKVFTPATVTGENTLHIQQLFDSPGDEAFYGLGSHQNTVMNYKGHDVDLWQHNIVDVIPLLVSSRHYGILWDNYSRTKFGDIRDYRPVAGLTLFNKQGNPGGLSVEYFTDNNFSVPLAQQTERVIEHDFVDQPGSYPGGFDPNTGSIRWSGEIGGKDAGVHKFRLYASGYVKVWLNGTLVVDAWRQNWLPWTHMLRLPMEPGKRYPVKIEWIPGGGNIGLKYLSPEDPVYHESLSLWSNVADQIDYYFIHGKTPDAIIQGYRTITGAVPMVPEWALGFWQSRERYRTQDEVLSVVKEFRKRQFPIDNIVQDWFYWKEDQWGSHEFDAERFPDPPGMVSTLHDSLHAHIMISVWPKFYVGTRHYDAFREKGWLYMHNIERGVRDWVGPGYVSTFMDPFSTGARDLFWAQVNTNLFSKGFDAWWLDSTEPDLQSNVSDEERILRMHPNAMGSGARYENAYSLMMTKGVYENQRTTRPDQRVFILTRSAYAGQQRYAAATWSGDVATRWYDLRAQIPAGLNFSLSGIPYWGTDIGGFAVEPRYEKPTDADLDEWRELNTRWFQFGAFLPLFRSHGQFPYREPFNLAPPDHPAYTSMLAYTRLRYRLMPYLYSLAGMTTQQGYTLMRALMMDFSDDARVLSIGDQFMLGPAIMVNPVTSYKARTRAVYLPSGTGWFDMTSGRHYDGGQTINAAAPYTEIPLFVREGAIIPCGPDLQYTGEKPADPIRVFVYAGHDGSFSLYEDEGVNYGYEKGSFSMIPFTYSETKKTLTIGKREGEFPGMRSTRTFEIVRIGLDNPGGLDFTAAPESVVHYDGSPKEVTLR